MYGTHHFYTVYILYLSVQISIFSSTCFKINVYMCSFRWGHHVFARMHGSAMLTSICHNMLIAIIFICAIMGCKMCSYIYIAISGLK